MNISHFGRLVGAGLLAMGLSSLAPQAAAKSFSQGHASGWNCFAHCDDADDDMDFDASAARGFMLASVTRGQSATWEQIARSLVPRGASSRGQQGQSPQFEIDVPASTPTVAAPVPEPQTWALLAAGLVAVGYMGRRKSRRS